MSTVNEPEPVAVDPDVAPTSRTAECDGEWDPSEQYLTGDL